MNKKNYVIIISTILLMGICLGGFIYFKDKNNTENEINNNQNTTNKMEDSFNVKDKENEFELVHYENYSYYIIDGNVYFHEIIYNQNNAISITEDDVTKINIDGIAKKIIIAYQSSDASEFLIAILTEEGNIYFMGATFQDSEKKIEEQIIKDKFLTFAKLEVNKKVTDIKNVTYPSLGAASCDIYLSYDNQIYYSLKKDSSTYTNTVEISLTYKEKKENDGAFFLDNGIDNIYYVEFKEDNISYSTLDSDVKVTLANNVNKFFQVDEDWYYISENKLYLIEEKNQILDSTLKEEIINIQINYTKQTITINNKTYKFDTLVEVEEK